MRLLENGLVPGFSREQLLRKKGAISGKLGRSPVSILGLMPLIQLIGLVRILFAKHRRSAFILTVRQVIVVLDIRHADPRIVGGFPIDMCSVLGLNKVIIVVLDDVHAHWAYWADELAARGDRSLPSAPAGLLLNIWHVRVQLLGVGGDLRDVIGGGHIAFQLLLVGLLHFLLLLVGILQHHPRDPLVRVVLMPTVNYL